MPADTLRPALGVSAAPSPTPCRPPSCNAACWRSPPGTCRCPSSRCWRCRPCCGGCTGSTALRRLRAELPTPGPHWPRRLAWLALCVGLGWALPVPITLHTPMPLFHLTLYAALCAVVSSGATYMGLLPVAFRVFSLTVLAVAMLGARWIFAGDWPFIAGALLLLGAITWRHARQNRRFMARQLALEEGYRRMSE